MPFTFMFRITTLIIHFIFEQAPCLQLLLSVHKCRRKTRVIVEAANFQGIKQSTVIFFPPGGVGENLRQRKLDALD